MSSVPEPEWDQESRDLLIAFGIVERLTGRYGEWVPDAISDEADPMSYSGWRYVPKGPFTNQAEKTGQDALDALRKEMGDDANLNGMYFSVERVDY